MLIATLVLNWSILRKKKIGSFGNGKVTPKVGSTSV